MYVSGSNAWGASASHAAASCDDNENDNRNHAPSINVASGKQQKQPGKHVFCCIRVVMFDTGGGCSKTADGAWCAAVAAEHRAQSGGGGPHNPCHHTGIMLHNAVFSFVVMFAFCCLRRICTLFCSNSYMTAVWCAHVQLPTLTFVCCCAHAAHDVLALQSAASCSGYVSELHCDILIIDCTLLMVMGDLYAGGGSAAPSEG